ncbi:MAG: NERD domain-containing protein [Candidatus Ranarchaeia archaeon]
MGNDKTNEFFGGDAPDSFAAFLDMRTAPSTRIFLGILWLTKDEPGFTLEKLEDHLKIYQNNFQSQLIEQTVSDLLKKGSLDGTTSIQGMLNVTPYGRFQITQTLLDQGLGLEVVSQLLNWQEFERFCRSIIEPHDFACYQNYRFTTKSKRHEIDIIAIRKPVILVVDAKRWASKITNTSALREASKAQQLRAKSYKESLKDNLVLTKFKLENWPRAEILPVVVSIYDQKIFIEKTGVVVPIFRLNDFLLNILNIWKDLPVLKTKIVPENLTLKE